MGILTSILVGAIAGWLADLVFKRFSFSLLVEFGKSSGILDGILTSFVGAVALLGIAALIKKST